MTDDEKRRALEAYRRELHELEGGNVVFGRGADHAPDSQRQVARITLLRQEIARLQGELSER